MVQRHELRVAIHQLLLAFAKRAIRRIALQLVQIRARVVTDARDQLDTVRQLDHVIVCTERERLPFHLRILISREDDDGNLMRDRVRPELIHERQPIDPRHHQILKDHRRPDLRGHIQSLPRIRTIMEINIRLARQRAPYRFAHHRLIVYKQHHGVILRRLRHHVRFVGED